MSQKINFEAEFCGKVPLHQTNLIQPHGILLIVDPSDLTIVQASENAGIVFNADIKKIVDQPLSGFIPHVQAEKFRQRIESKFSGKLPFTFSFPTGNYLAVLHAEDRYIVMEIEKEKRNAGTDDSFIAIYQELKYVMQAVEAEQTTEDTCRIAITELKKISGFDKIMVYRFDEEWNGDVIAEVKEEGMDAYIGLKFPASDIPRQARELYRKTPYRLIPNVNYEPVRLYPVINPLTNAFTDLSYSNLRSVAGVHLEYLRNMKVITSMSTRILVDGQLWGLIACHHREPKYLSFEMCSVFELLSNVISAKIASVQKQDAFVSKEEKQLLYSDLVEDFYRSSNLGTSFEKNHESVLKMLHADGLAVVMNREIESFGNTPDKKDISDLVLWLQSTQGNRMYHQPHMTSVFEPAERFAEKASGMLSLPIQPEKGNYVLAFRNEAVKNVEWGGNPNEAVQFEADRKNYHPRNSFRIWKETVRQTSVPWTIQELEMAEQFRNFILEFTLNRIYNN